MPEEEYTREFKSTARSMHIPEDNWGNPIVQRFVELVSVTERLQEDMSRAYSETPDRFTLPLVEQRRLLDAPDLVHSLRDRYNSAELLLRAVNMILTMNIGRNYESGPNRYVVSKINVALSRYGYHVEKDK